MLPAYDQLQRTANALSHCYEHAVRVGMASMTVGLTHPHLAQRLDRARQSLNDVNLHIVECDGATLVRHLHDGMIVRPRLRTIYRRCPHWLSYS